MSLVLYIYKAYRLPELIIIPDHCAYVTRTHLKITIKGPSHNMECHSDPIHVILSIFKLLEHDVITWAIPTAIVYHYLSRDR